VDRYCDYVFKLITKACTATGYFSHILVSLLLLLAPHHREDSDEDVGEVQEHVDRHVHGVVVGVVQPAGPVQIVDHDGREQQDAHVVEEGDGEAVVQPEHRQEGCCEGDDDQAEQASEQRRAPHGQVLGDDCSDESGDDDHTG
jgi:hypothetical protein